VSVMVLTDPAKAMSPRQHLEAEVRYQVALARAAGLSAVDARAALLAEARRVR
jgi:hypothetical protein